MTTIYLVRHGEAEGNLYRRAQGVYNGQLTKFGKLQTLYLAKRFENIQVDLIFASDLNRAYNTAKAIADVKGINVTTSENLREINMGVMEDRPWADLPRLYSEIADGWNRDAPNITFSGGETPKQAKERFVNEVLKIAKENQDKSIVIGAHGTVIRYFLFYAQGKVLGVDQEEWCDNTAVTKITIDENINIEYKNDASHISTLKNAFLQKKWWEFEANQETLNLWFSPLNLDNDFDLAHNYIKMINKIAFLDENFSKTEDIYENIKQNLQINKESAVFAKLKDKTIGFVQADIVNSPENIGIIAKLIINEDIRGSFYAPQLIGAMVSLYRKLGKKILRVTPTTINIRAIKFYEKLGFIKTAEVTDNYDIKHYIMDMEI